MKKSVLLLTILIISGTILFLTSLVIDESNLQIAIAQEGETIRGFRISKPLSLSAITSVATSSMEWEASITDEKRIIIKTAVTEDGINPPESWQAEYRLDQDQGSTPIVGIEPGMDLSGQYLWVMQILESDIEGESPALYSLTETIIMEARTEGERISPEFSLSDKAGEKVKNSRIFWQANERFDGNVNLEVKLSTEGEWKEAVNGASIPGLEAGESLSGEKIQTKASFVGGPNFYPSLENIKIFLELE